MEKNKNRKGLSAGEYFSNADITDLAAKELQKLNDEKDMIWYDVNVLNEKLSMGLIFTLICDVNVFNE